VVFYDGMAASVNKGRPEDIIYLDGVTATVNRGRVTAAIFLDFCKAFDMVPHHILLSKLERHGLERWTVQ